MNQQSSSPVLEQTGNPEEVRDKRPPKFEVFLTADGINFGDIEITCHQSIALTVASCLINCQPSQQNPGLCKAVQALGFKIRDAYGIINRKLDPKIVGIEIREDNGEVIG